MERDTEPRIWPTWKLSELEAERFYRGSGMVTVALNENHELLGVVYHTRRGDMGSLTDALERMRSDFPDAQTRTGSMRGHYFCEDLEDSGWAEARDYVKQLKRPDLNWPKAREDGERGGKQEPEIDHDR